MTTPTEGDDDDRRRVLIADDEANIVTSLEFLMGREGYEVALATDGKEALRQVEEFRPDLVLLDVAMPHLDGFAVAQRIRADHGSSIAIVMLTAKGQEAEVAKGVALGADLYVTKPFSTRDLVADIRRILDRSPAEPADLELE
jgi:DNA-binding response OmpR family regulator